MKYEYVARGLTQQKLTIKPFFAILLVYFKSKHTERFVAQNLIFPEAHAILYPYTYVLPNL